MLEEEQKEQDEGDEEEELERAHLQLSHNSAQLKFAVCHAPPRSVAEGHNSYLLLVLFRRWELAEKLISKSIHYMMRWLPPSARKTRGKFEENCLLLSVGKCSGTDSIKASLCRHFLIA